MAAEDLVFTKNGIPCEDQEAAKREFVEKGMTTTDKLAERLDAEIKGNSEFVATLKSQVANNKAAYEESGDDHDYYALSVAESGLQEVSEKLEFLQGLRTTLTTQQSEINRLRVALEKVRKCCECDVGYSIADAALAEGESHENT